MISIKKLLKEDSINESMSAAETEAEKYAEKKYPNWRRKTNDVYNDSDAFDIAALAFVAGAEWFQKTYKK